MSFSQKLAALNGGGRAKTLPIAVSTLPADAILWGPEELQANAVNVQVVACDVVQKKDGSGALYKLTIADGSQILSNEPCATGVARIVKIPGGVHTAFFNAGKWSEDTVQVCADDRVKILSSNAIATLEMRMIARQKAGIVAVD